MPARYALAHRRAREFLAQAKITEPPVPVEDMAQLAGAMLVYESLSGPLSGMVQRRSDGTAVIGINKDHSKTRRRFTIAHEIGHILLHAEEQLHVDERYPFALRDDRSSLAIDAREIEANQFAAALLMPEQFLRADVLERLAQDSEEETAALARRYGVSAHAMAIRLSVLHLVG